MKNLPIQFDLYIPMGSYGPNQEHLWLDGNPCKALTEYKGKFLGTYPLIIFGGLGLINKVFINGPAGLEKIITESKGYIDPKKIVLLKETMPGDTDIAAKDAIKHLKSREDLSEYILFAGCDFNDLTPQKAYRIINDLLNHVADDLQKERPADIYFAVSDVRDEEGAYARIKDLKIDRKGVILNSSEAIRFGGNILLRRNALYEKSDAIMRFPDHFRMRKVQKAPLKSVNYWWEILNNGPEENKYERKKVLAKVVHNWIKKHIMRDAPIMPYMTTTLEEINLAISQSLGLNFKFVKTIGSADIDNQQELIASRLNGI